MQRAELKFNGQFQCRIFSDGKLVMEFSEKNLIVNAGKRRLIEGLQSGNIPALSKIGFGSSNEIPTLGDVQLGDPIFFKNIIAATIVDPDPESNSFAIRYDWFLGTSEGNGMNIQEFGLFFDDMHLFARKIGINVAKTPSITLTGSWTINMI